MEKKLVHKQPIGVETVRHTTESVASKPNRCVIIIKSL